MEIGFIFACFLLNTFHYIQVKKFFKQDDLLRYTYFNVIGQCLLYLICVVSKWNTQKTKEFATKRYRVCLNLSPGASTISSAFEGVETRRC